MYICMYVGTEQCMLKQFISESIVDSSGVFCRDIFLIYSTNSLTTLNSFVSYKHLIFMFYFIKLIIYRINWWGINTWLLTIFSYFLISLITSSTFNLIMPEYFVLKSLKYIYVARFCTAQKLYSICLYTQVLILKIFKQDFLVFS